MPHAPRDTPLQVNIENDQLVIRIGIDVLADATQRHSEWMDDDDNSLLTVTDNGVFARSVAAALRHEEEDGTTPIDVMLDDAITYVVEQGEEGVDLREELHDATGDEDDEDDE